MIIILNMPDKFFFGILNDILVGKMKMIKK